jgi:ABC-type amino acid transport substrate-binding protein
MSSSVILGVEQRQLRLVLFPALAVRAIHDKIAAALAALEANGKYAAILKQWKLSGDDITAG